MKKTLILPLFAISMLLCSCGNQASTRQPSDDTVTPGETDEPGTGDSSTETEEQEDKNVIITLNKTTLDLVISKYEYLTVNFPEGYEYDSEGGTWESSNSTVAEVSKYGKVTAKSVGTTFISYTASTGVKSSKCAVYVFESSSSIVREYKKVNDANTIQNGDIIVFGCPEFGVTASINRKSGYLLPSETTFSTNGDKITSLGVDTAEFFVGKSGENSFTLESQEGLYLAGKQTTTSTGLSFVQSKGQINWIFERPVGYQNDYCVNDDIATDLWLMFNKINSSDIRFNLYDSNVTELMKLPTIYRYEIVR